jgi:hypothetical protein
MAVVIQEVVGRRQGDRFYPHLSGVARSYNYYPMGPARPEEGVVDLALGLGKTIVDGGLVWTYSPAHPRIQPPVGSPGELLKRTQTAFWAVNMGKPPAYDPLRETEYLCQGTLSEAEADGVLDYLVSTYRPQDDRITPGLGAAGPRVLTFAPLLVTGALPFNALVKELLEVSGDALGGPVEIEFALNLGPDGLSPARLGFLQVRPMMVSREPVVVGREEMVSPRVLVASERALGNGVIDTLEDVVYVRPDRFEAKMTPKIAMELTELNRGLMAVGRGYMLVGFGRWGSSDPWLGIPVEWAQICGARAIVEATLPEMNVELSQGSHFFHNITAFQVYYFSVSHTGEYRIGWDWLEEQEAVAETQYAKHVRLSRPLTVKVDGRSGRGVILR